MPTCRILFLPNQSPNLHIRYWSVTHMITTWMCRFKADLQSSSLHLQETRARVVQPMYKWGYSGLSQWIPMYNEYIPRKMERKKENTTQREKRKKQVLCRPNRPSLLPVLSDSSCECETPCLSFSFSALQSSQKSPTYFTVQVVTIISKR
jgi:hypothetical protein